jgi:hypothetical protein
LIEQRGRDGKALPTHRVHFVFSASLSANPNTEAITVVGFVVKMRSVRNKAVPEQFTILQGLQSAANYWKSP